MDRGKETEGVLVGSEGMEIAMGKVGEDVLLGARLGRCLCEFAGGNYWGNNTAKAGGLLFSDVGEGKESVGSRGLAEYVG